MFVPIGYSSPALQDLSEVIGGSPYGAASISAGDGSRQVSAKELEIAAEQGTKFAKIVNTYVKGKAASA
jgi:NAD(P)H dehydrogenase (quinone)